MPGAATRVILSRCAWRISAFRGSFQVGLISQRSEVHDTVVPKHTIVIRCARWSCTVMQSRRHLIGFELKSLQNKGLGYESPFPGVLAAAGATQSPSEDPLSPSRGVLWRWFLKRGCQSYTQSLVHPSHAGTTQRRMASIVERDLIQIAQSPCTGSTWGICASSSPFGHQTPIFLTTGCVGNELSMYLTLGINWLYKVPKASGNKG